MTDIAAEPVAQGTTGQIDASDGTIKSEPGQSQTGTGAVENWMANLPPEALAYIEELRRTASGHTKAAEQARKELNELKQSQMSDVERAGAEVDTLREQNLQLKNMLRTQALQRAATEAGKLMQARNPDRVWRFLNREEIVWDDNTGEPTNIQQLLSELKKTDDYLFSPPQPTGGADGGNRGRKPAPGSDMTARIRAAAGRRRA